MHDNTRILLMDTSGKTGAVGLACNAGVVDATPLPGATHHAAELMPTIEKLLAGQGWPPDSFTDVFLTIGPGSFTGLRLGVSVARTLAWSVGAKLVAVPTLAVLARNALAVNPPPPHVAVLLDAKRGQAFAACFALQDARGSSPQEGHGLAPPDTPRLPSQHEPCFAPQDARGLTTQNRYYATLIDACLEEPRPFLARCPRPLAVLGEGIPLHQDAATESGATILPPELWPARAEHLFALGIEKAEAGQYTPPGDLVPLYVRRPEMEERWEKRQAQQR